MDDINCKVRGDGEEYLKIANLLHKNLQFTSDKVNMEGDWAFLDINATVGSESNISCH